MFTVLVADDEPGIRSGVARILRNFHVTYPFMDEDYTYEVLEAATGEEGIEIIDREKPDIMLLDNKLPGIQGVEVLEYVKKVVELYHGVINVESVADKRTTFTVIVPRMQVQNLKEEI